PKRPRLRAVTSDSSDFPAGDLPRFLRDAERPRSQPIEPQPAANDGLARFDERSERVSGKREATHGPEGAPPSAVRSPSAAKPASTPAAERGDDKPSREATGDIERLEAS